MYKLRPFLPLKIMKSIYYSLAYSHINYGIEAWGSACKIELDKILKLQKRAVRLMTNNDHYPDTPGPLVPSNPIFKRLELLKVEDVFNLQINKFIFKCLNLTTPPNFSNWFTLRTEVHKYNTRASVVNGKSTNDLYYSYARTTNYGLKQIKVYGPRIWNNLSRDLRNCSSLPIFLKHLKNFYLAHYLT